jgi:replication factor C subunit 3/5
MRRAILMLETLRVQIAPDTQLMSTQTIILPDWEQYIIKLCDLMLRDQTPSALIEARNMLYDLLTNCIPSDIILKTICRELLKKLDDSVKHEVVHWAAYYEHRVCLGSKDIFHLEAFVVKFMAIYKKYIISMF